MEKNGETIVKGYIQSPFICAIVSKIIMYLVAILLPPIAVLVCGKPIQAVINLLLCFLLFIPGIIHAILVVREYKADKWLRQITITKVRGLPDWYEEPEEKSDAPVYIALAAIIAITLIFIIMEII